MENDELSHEQAAAQWSEAKRRLARAQENNAAALDAVQRVTELAYQQAAVEERIAWRQLERVAGRGRENPLRGATAAQAQELSKAT